MCSVLHYISIYVISYYIVLTNTHSRHLGFIRGREGSPREHGGACDWDVRFLCIYTYKCIINDNYTCSSTNNKQYIPTTVEGMGRRTVPQNLSNTCCMVTSRLAWSSAIQEPCRRKLRGRVPVHSVVLPCISCTRIDAASLHITSICEAGGWTATEQVISEEKDPAMKQSSLSSVSASFRVLASSSKHL